MEAVSASLATQKYDQHHLYTTSDVRLIERRGRGFASTRVLSKWRCCVKYARMQKPLCIVNGCISHNVTLFKGYCRFVSFPLSLERKL